MSIISNITKNCTQTAVYWASPTPDGKGGMTYADPVEISCRWEDRVEVVAMAGEDRKGIEEVSKAVVYVLQDVAEQGMLYLGTLDDLDSDEEDAPETIDGAYRIKRFDKIPRLGSTTEFMRKAYI